MYNRILKRPMFKRGGSSFQAQGTGITSPYDTPRKKYALGDWGEWETKTRDVTKDPRGDWSYAAQGFSSLGNPYKESGAAKTIGEMLWEGAQGVRGSKDKARELEQKGELAILESQGGRMLSDEERAWKEEQAGVAHGRKLEEIELAGKFKTSEEYLKKTPRDRQVIDEKKILAQTITDPYGFVATFIDRIASGTVDARFASGPADVIPTNLFEEVDGKYGFEETKLSVDRVWWDPVRGLWLVLEDTDGDGKANNIVYESVNVEDALKIFSGGEYQKKSKQSSDDLAPPEEKKKKVATKFKEDDYSKYTAEDFMPKSSPDVIEESIKTADKTGEEITKFWEWVASPKRGTKIVVQKAKGGRLGYETGDLVDPSLGDLNRWWKSQLNSNTWNKEIKDEG